MAPFTLVAWPFIACIMAAVWGPRRGLLISIIVGYLFLPQNYGIDLPGLPAYMKDTAVAAGVVLALLLNRQKLETPKFQFDKTFTILVVILIGGGLLTVLANSDGTTAGGRSLQGLGLSDLVAMTFEALVVITPYLFARKYLSTLPHHREVLIALVMAGLAYSAFVLIETRMSPQFHRWVYGYFQHSFAQHKRGGGWRPAVFLQHGLWVGFFLLSVTIAAVAALKSPKVKNRTLMLYASGFLFFVLTVSNNLGAWMLGIMFCTVVLFSTARMQTQIVAWIAIVFLTFPLARQADVVPLDQVVSLAASIDENRALSFQYRLKNEDAYLERASLRPVTGWGGWGRWRIYNERGVDTSTSDGIWIIILGERGWLGYLGFFGLLCFPLIMLGLRGRIRRTVSPETAGLALIVAANLVYLIPNSALSPLGWLVAGALAGYVQYGYKADQEIPKEAEVLRRVAKSYTRFPQHQRT